MGLGSESATAGGEWPTEAWLATEDGAVEVPPIRPGFVCKWCKSRPCICDFLEPEFDGVCNLQFWD